MNRTKRDMQTNPRRYSFGSTAAIVTSMGLIVGLDAATMPRASVISSLLIIALADNISDSLSIHVYQESEELDGRAAFRATITNFFARLCVALSFVGVVALLPSRWTVPVSLTWGLCLLVALTFSVARARNVKPWPEIVKHVAVAALVIVVSRAAASVIFLCMAS
jgi:VIT1/CCC1 family predicted Fe2+/Mn2+ transporter